MKTEFLLYDKSNRIGTRTLQGEFDSPVRFNVGDDIDLATIVEYDEDRITTISNGINDKEGHGLPCSYEAMGQIHGNGCKVLHVSFRGEGELIQEIMLELN